MVTIKKTTVQMTLTLRALVWACAYSIGSAAYGRTVTVEPGPKAQKNLQTALIEAQTGDVVQIAEGHYDFTATLSLDVAGVTVRGEGADKTILSFKNLKQGTGGEGLLVTAGGFTLEDIAVEDVRGDAVKVTGADGVTLRRVRVEWTDGPKTTNGSYGLYPVLCRNVLVEECVVRGSSDAGIYVGQSRNIIIRRNRAYQNVAGIEIENSVAADVYDNELSENAAGLLIFTLPDLVEKQCRTCRAFKNKIVGNNHENFAPKGNIVAQVPKGTGLMVMAGDDIEIFENELADNQTVNLALISYLATHLDFSDKEFDPYCEKIWVHDNRFKGGGDKPAGELALLKVVLFRRTLPDMVLDWSENESRYVDGALPPELRSLFSDNGDADFARIDLAAKVPSPSKVSQELTSHVGRHAPLAAVRLEDPRIKSSKPRPAAPERLSAYGFFHGKAAEQQPAPGVVPYDVNTPLFSDYTVKHRFVRLPRGSAANYSADDIFDLPVGTQLVKTFAMPRDLRRPDEGERLLETRVLSRGDAGWSGVSYVWNDKQTDAFLAVAGDAIDVAWTHSDGEQRTNNYIVPNVNQCKGCHATSAGMAPIGIKARHLNREFDYDDAIENQLTHWTKVGALKGAPSAEQAPRAVRWDDTTVALNDRARVWLEINCAHCHQPGGSAQNSGLDLRLSQNDPTKLGILKPPVAAGTGSGGMQFDILPGKPDRSIMMVRLRSTHPDVMMPELGKRLVPEEAVELIGQWITQMK